MWKKEGVKRGSAEAKKSGRAEKNRRSVFFIHSFLILVFSQFRRFQGTHRKTFMDNILPGIGFDKSNPYIGLNYRNGKGEKTSGKEYPHVISRCPVRNPP